MANVSGNSVQLQTALADGTPITSNRFPGIANGASIYINPQSADGQPPIPYTVDHVDSAFALTLTGSAGTQTLVPYLVEYGGEDGNNLTVYITVRTPNVRLSVDKTVLTFSGGSSDVTWHISLDFSALGIDQIRQAWVTFAPKLANATVYTDTEWTATFSNWSVRDPNNVRTLKIAGPGSLRIGNADPACQYTGGWATQGADNYWRGFAQVSHQAGDTLTISYTTPEVHDLYLGTGLYVDRRQVSASLDGDSASKLDCYLNTGSEVVTRRLLRQGVAAGTHTVTFTVGDVNPLAISTAGIFAFVFDYLEAAVPTVDVADAMVTYQNMSPALDFDTDATYKMSPQRLLWHVLKLGFRGQLNEYLGVFWWNQRKRSGGVWNTASIDFSQQAWESGDTAFVSIGSFKMAKSVILWETNDPLNSGSHVPYGQLIAQHFVFYINSATVSMWAELTGDSTLTIHTRTPNFGDTISAARRPGNSAGCVADPKGCSAAFRYTHSQLGLFGERV